MKGWQKILLIIAIVVILAIVAYYIYNRYRKVPGTNYTVSGLISSLSNLYVSRITGKSNDALYQERWVKDWLSGVYEKEKQGENISGWDFTQPYDAEANKPAREKVLNYLKESYSLSKSQVVSLIRSMPQADLINDLIQIGVDRGQASDVANYLKNSKI